MRKLTTKEFVLNAQQCQKQVYDYSKLVYVDSITKVEIVCPKHGNFWQLPHNHLRGQGCKECFRQSQMLAKVWTTAEFIKKSKCQYKTKYDYSRTVYVNNHKKVDIICPEHGVFSQLPSNHLLGREGCRECFRVNYQGKKAASWNGCGELSKNHWSSIKRRAQDRGIEFNISIEYAWKLFLHQKRKCAITGWLLKMHIPGRGNKNATWTASLDRIDSIKGYVRGNVQWVHSDIYKMKLDHPTQRFYELCDAVVQYRQQSEQPMSAEI